MTRSLIRPALDLRHRAFTRTHHGIVCIGTWLTAERGGRTQPCLVLLHPLRPISAGRTIPIVIAMDALWQYAQAEDKSVGDPVAAAIQITDWLACGDLPGDVHNPRDHFRILDAINECIRDVYAMPPKPDFGSYAIGDVVITDRTTGKVIAEQEISNSV